MFDLSVLSFPRSEFERESFSMPVKITEERIKTIAKKLNVCSTDLTPEELLGTSWRT
jgi:hypothetical protein